MKVFYLLLGATLILASCSKSIEEPQINNGEIATVAGGNSNHESATFAASATIDLGESGAAEISAFDPLTKKLFVVNNTAGNNRVDVVNLTNPSSPAFITSIPVSPYGGSVNSVYVKHGKLAAAIEATVKTNPGKVVVFNTETHAEIAVRTVGAQPDMVTFSPDGLYILSANEGEPNDAYTIDPIGTVSIIDIKNNYEVTTLDFGGFASQWPQLKAGGLRVFGPNASFAQDMEPEYIAVSANSKTAWVTLQENNGIAKIDISTRSITKGDTDGDGDYDEIYAQGARSFSIWNGNTGELLFDSKMDLDLKAVANNKYPESRSDDKSTEPEGLAIGRVGNKNLLFVGMERADAVAVYNVTDVEAPVFLQWLNTGVGPEGVLFVPASDSPNGKSLLIVSSEVDGLVKIFTTL
jgi:DNA-binding beta-propeller fold protein YncE